MPKLTEEEQSIIVRHERLLSLVERAYMNVLIIEKNRFIREYSFAYGQTGTPDNILWNQHELNIQGISQRFNARIIRIFAREGINNTIKTANIPLEFKVDANFERWLTTIIAFWISTESGIAATQIATTTLDDIKTAVRAAQLDDVNATDSQIAKNILKARGLSPFRAETIALTETHNAAMYASKESALKLSRDTEIALQKKWLPVEDSRTRSSHAGMYYQKPITMEGKFKVPRKGGFDNMDRPGDPKGSAANVIRCRCALKYV